MITKEDIDRIGPDAMNVRIVEQAKASLRDTGYEVIKASELKELREAQSILIALEDAGVDNWQGYELALKGE